MKKLISNVRPPKKKGKGGKAENSFFGTSLTKSIDDMLRKQNGTFWKQSSSFAPSTTNLCPRYLNYRLTGFNRDVKFPARTYRIFDNGNGAHERLCSYFQRMGILKEEEREFWTTDPPIHGFIDAIIFWEGEEVVVEIKSISEYGFRDVKLFNKAKADHVRQIQLYLWATGLQYGFIVYENKNNQMLIAIEVEKDLEVIEPILELYRKVYKVHKKGDIPARPYDKESKECGKCDAYNFCWGDDRVGVEID